MATNTKPLSELKKFNHKQSEEYRAKIRVGELTKRLHDHALADGDLMTQSQVAAARLLLDKALSDAPKDVNTNVSGEMTLVIETGVPRK